MARFNSHSNSKVGREAAEHLQENLFLAATSALDTALESGNIPGTLLSACQIILSDSRLAPDLDDVEDDGQRASACLKPSCLRDMQSELGLDHGQDVA